MGAGGMKDLCRIIEALLFVADGPLTVEQIQEAVPEAGAEEIEQALDELQTLYGDGDRGIALFPVGPGRQILTRPEVSPWVERLLAGRRRQRLSRAALEVLAIVAYQQPVTRGEVETVRGVDCGATLHTLLERKLVTIRGRARTVGHPLLYVTTPAFLEHFGLATLADLPKLVEFAALMDREEARAELREKGILAAPTDTASAAEAIAALDAGEGCRESEPWEAVDASPAEAAPVASDPPESECV